LEQLCKGVYAIAKHCKMNNNHLKRPCCQDWRFKVKIDRLISSSNVCTASLYRLWHRQSSIICKTW
jgi:hypothetical protein